MDNFLLVITRPESSAFDLTTRNIEETDVLCVVIQIREKTKLTPLVSTLAYNASVSLAMNLKCWLDLHCVS